MTETLRKHYRALSGFRRDGRDRRRPKRIGEATYAITFPPSLATRNLRGRLHTPTHAPGCDIPPDNSGTVTVEATIDPATGVHSYAGAQPSGACINDRVIEGLRELVIDTWSSDPIRTADGAVASLLEGEAIRLTVDFSIRAEASR